VTPDEVQYRVEDGLATVTLHRPERLNAWTPTMERQLRQAMETAAEDGAVRVILLTGAGRGFCAGLDSDHLQARQGGNSPAAESISDDFAGRFTYFPSIPKPILAVVNGPAAGSGFVLTLACDLRFAGSEAFFTTAFSRRGLTAEHGVSWLLPRLIGMGSAQDLLLSARRVSAEEALRIGLVNRVFPQADLLTEARRYARELIQSCSPRSLAIIKRQLWGAMFQTLAQAVETADREMHASFHTDDFREGIAHLREKRPPRFAGS
jgi:enoyl-CoA hydratase/carnithine racemase